MINKVWQCLIDVVFNEEKEVPIEFISQFRNLAKQHNLEEYYDYLRGKTLPDTLLKDPWEWKYLEDLSKVLPDTVQILVLKGAAVRDMDLYQLPSLRKSADLDIFIYGLESYAERKNFIMFLAKEKIIELYEGWEKSLKVLKNVTCSFRQEMIDIHFELTSPISNLNYLGLCIKERNKELEDKIMERSTSYRDLHNVKKMSCEDFFLNNIFHFLKEFPFTNFFSIIDLHLILKSGKTSLHLLEKHAKETNQLYLYKIGLNFLITLSDSYDKKLKINFVYKTIFNINKFGVPNKYSINNVLTEYFSKAILVTNGNRFLSFILGGFYFFINKIILTNFEENPFALTPITNLTNKFLYTVAKIRNCLKDLCLRAAKTGEDFRTEESLIIKTDKKLITVKINDLQITFSVPAEFYNDLAEIWKGFLTDEHLLKQINVEKIISKNENQPYDVVYSDGQIYMSLPNGSKGMAGTNSSGFLSAETFWDIRTFALCLFRAMTFERDDLLLVHASGIKVSSGAVISPAGTSAGKTTFFNLALNAGFQGINDDTLLLKKEKDGVWFVYPACFMSNKLEPILCKETKLVGIIDLMKVAGGHEIKPIDKANALALMLNNSISDFVIDDAGFILSNTSKKIQSMNNQIIYTAGIKYSIDNTDKLIEFFNNWLDKPTESYSDGSKLIRLIELRGNSMRPAFNEGDILYVEEISLRKLKAKDVICFTKDSNSFPIVHRIKYLIKHKEQTTVITKGDNSLFEDPPNVFKTNKNILKVIKKFDPQNN